MSIQGLPLAVELASSDSLPVGIYSEGADRRAPLALLLEWLQGQLTTSGAEQSYYFAPNATGFSVTVVPMVVGGSVWLQMAPLAVYANGTIVLPTSASLVNGQELLCTSTQAITALAVNGNGATVNGAPTGLAQHGYFRLRYQSINNVWQRIG